jgi:carbon monoxide dehydrogenase subunit G
MVMWKLAAAFVIAAAVTALGVAAWQPSGYRLERSLQVAAPAELLVNQLADLQRWPAWSPAENRDPGVEWRFGGLMGSPGASGYWSGSEGRGRGRWTVVGVGPDHVDVEQEMEAPQHALADLEFRLAPEGEGTRVTFTTAGENGLLARLRWHLAGGRRAAEADMEARLVELKAATEALPRREVRRVERSALLAVAPEVVHARLVDLQGWGLWSPLPGLAAPGAILGGPGDGVGASIYWSAGAAETRGRMTIVISSPELVELELEVGGGDVAPASNDLAFRLAPEGRGTRVTWTATGDGGLADADLERGLVRLKSLSERRM